MIEAIGLTSFSREEFDNALAVNGTNAPELELAKKFFVVDCIYPNRLE